jgi:hypothetical protein
MGLATASVDNPTRRKFMPPMSLNPTLKNHASTEEISDFPK